MVRKAHLLLLALLAATGCQQSPPPTTPLPGNNITDVTSNTVDPNAPTHSPDDIFTTEASASRLQDIGGDLLLYYRINSKMPETLDDLKALFGPDSQPTLLAPSGKPYPYVPAGLWIPNKDRAIVVYDPDMNPNGKRWCLVMDPPKPGAALSVNVVEIPEPIFLSYRESGK